MAKSLILFSLLFILQSIDSFSQNQIELIPFELKTPDRAELISYMTKEIEYTYYWKEDLVKFFTLRHPVGSVNFAAKSSKGDIYYFVWRIGIVPQLVAAEKSIRLAEGKKLAEKRDLEIANTTMKKDQIRRDSLYTTYKTYIDTSVLAAPLEYKDNLKKISYEELNRLYETYTKYDTFKEHTDHEIKGSVEKNIQTYNDEILLKSINEKLKRIDEINSLINETILKVSYGGRISEKSKQELIDTLRKDFTDVCPDELNMYITTLTGTLWDLNPNLYKMRVEVPNGSNSKVTDYYYLKAQNFEKIGLAVKKFLEKRIK